MGNSWFQFKQFTVQQDRTAMKVCTDSCVFGAVVPAEEAVSVLDIGTGTGLLSLMLAQRSDAAIDAVELEDGAAAQAKENFTASPWADRIVLHHCSIQDYFKFTTRTYDLIISNPPFFSSSLKSTSAPKNMALHQSHLSVEELIQVIAFMLNQTGNAYLLISMYEEEIYLQAAREAGLHCYRYMTVSDHPGKEIRAILQLSRQPQPEITQSFSIRERAGGPYTAAFRTALAPFYLHL